MEMHSIHLEIESSHQEVDSPNLVTHSSSLEMDSSHLDNGDWTPATWRRTQSIWRWTLDTYLEMDSLETHEMGSKQIAIDSSC